MANSNLTIFIDTNKLGNYNREGLFSENFNYVSISKDLFTSLIVFLRDNAELLGKIKLVLPKIVVEELKIQQIKSFFSELSKLNHNYSKFKGIEGFNLDIPNIDYKSHLDEKFDIFLSKYSIVLLEYPDNSIFPKLIDKALNKKKPFCKRDKDKDSGFKDAIIWESILKYSIDKKENDFILFTKDGDFDYDELKEEFLHLTGKNIKIITTLSEIKMHLDEIKELKLNIGEDIKRYDYEMSQTLNHILGQIFGYIKTEEGIFPTTKFITNTSPLDINIIDSNKYELSVQLSVTHETQYTGYEQIDDIYSNYQEDSCMGIAKLKLEKSENDIFLIDIDFEGLDLIASFPISRVRVS